MTKRKFFSLKYKVLLLMTLIPVIALVAYLLMASRIYENDKIAYVFDSSSNMASSTAAQVRLHLGKSIQASRSILQDFVKEQQFSPIGQALFDEQSNLDYVVVFNKINEKSDSVVKGQLEKKVGSFEEARNVLGNKLSAYEEELKQNRFIVKLPFNDERVYLLEKIRFEDASEGELNYFVTALHIPDVAQIFALSNQKGKLYLINKAGEILMGPQGELGRLLHDIMPLSFLTEQGSSLGQGVEETLSGGIEYLAAFAKIGIGDLYVVNSVPKALALSATKVLIRKSLVFVGLLICITAILSLFTSNKITHPLTALFEATSLVSRGNFKIRVQVDSQDEVGILAENFNMMAAEVSRLLDETAEKARMASELQTAKMVQETLFPASSARIGTIELRGFYEPASECGGDWWHYCIVGHKVFFWIGDATGHGAAAALITSAARSAAAVIERFDLTPGTCMEILNRCIYDVSKGQLMMTFFLASYDPLTSELTYANASHDPPFFLKHNPTGDFKKRDLILLNETINPRLGQERDTGYGEVTLKFEQGDSILFYTDGLPDIRNEEGKGWGEREFVKAVLSSHKGNPHISETYQRLVQTFQGYRKNAGLVDDVTFVLIRNMGAQNLRNSNDEGVA